MSWKSRQLGQTRTISLLAAAGVTVTGTNPSGEVQAPLSNTIAILTGNKLTEWVSTGEVWRPIGVQWMTTTSTTVTIPAVTLQKNQVAPSSGGVSTQGALRTAPFGEYQTFTNYAYAAADAAGDKWRVATSTAATAGVVNFSLHYALIDVAGLSDALTTF